MLLEAENKNELRRSLIFCGACLLFLLPFRSLAQGNAVAGARIDARQIMVGDQARLFIEVQNNPSAANLQWAVIPDTFNNLEVVERGRIDTIRNGANVTYRQRLLITGFDSGMYKVPPFVFAVTPNGGTPYTIQTDSFNLLVQTVAVDTTKGFKGIKGIMYVKSTWLDYLGIIIGAIVFIVLIVYVVLYFIRNKKHKPAQRGPVESLQDYTLRLLAALDTKQLWQKKQVKEYYISLTEIVRGYIEKRFNTPALELTTEELLEKTQDMPDMLPYRDSLAQILQTADLAKFARFQPLPQEHIDAMEQAKYFVNASRPAAVAEPQAESANPDTK